MVYVVIIVKGRVGVCVGVREVGARGGGRHKRFFRAEVGDVSL